MSWNPSAPKKRIRPFLTGILLLMLLGLSECALSANALESGSAAPRADQLSVSLQVMSDSCAPLDDIPIGDSVYIKATVSIDRGSITLYSVTCLVDNSSLGARAEGFNLSEGSRNVEASWLWTPTALGRYLVLVEAIGNTTSANGSVTVHITGDAIWTEGPVSMGWDEDVPYWYDVMDYGNDAPIFFIGQDQLMMSPQINNTGGRNLNITVTLWLDNKKALLRLPVEVLAHQGQRPVLMSNLSGFDISDGTHSISMGISNDPLGDIAGLIFSIRNPMPGVRVTGITVPDDLHVGDTVQLKAHVVNEGKDYAGGLLVYFYDNTTRIGSVILSELEPGTSKDAEVTIEVPRPPEANHTFRARIYHQSVNVTRMVAGANIGLTRYFAWPSSVTINRTVHTARTTLNLTLVNSGSLAGIVNLTIGDDEEILITQNITVPAHGQVSIAQKWVLKSGRNIAYARLDGLDANPDQSYARVEVTATKAATFPDLSFKCTVATYLPLLLLPAIFIRAIKPRRR